MALYDDIRTLDLQIETVSLDRRTRPTSSGFDRVTTIVELAGDGVVGYGEDVTYETDHHDTLHERGPWDLAGEYTIDSFSQALDDHQLFSDEPARPTFEHYRHWALESAALDLALRQGDTRLGPVLDHDVRDPHFVVSTSLDEDPGRVDDLLAAIPGLEFKLDPNDDWDDELVDHLAATGAVRVLDMKDQYGDVDFTDDNPVDLYRTVIDAFPDAIIEDPAVTPETSDIVESARERVAWDAPIHGIEDAERLPWTPRWLNVKPSRFGTLESLFDLLDWADQHDVSLYGGGQFELGVGRRQIQELAAIFYPDGPNDIAPMVYNDPGVPEDAPVPPIDIPSDRPGFGW